MTNTPLWATYLEMYRGDGANQKRKQWVILPPVPASIAPAGMRALETPSYFYRQQERKDHKSVWRVYHLSTDGHRKALLQSIDAAEDQGWTARPMVTCQVHPDEMRQIVETGWKTPYRILQRMDRVAQVLHGYPV